MPGLQLFLGVRAHVDFQALQIRAITIFPGGPNLPPGAVRGSCEFSLHISIIVVSNSAPASWKVKSLYSLIDVTSLATVGHLLVGSTGVSGPFNAFLMDFLLTIYRRFNCIIKQRVLIVRRTIPQPLYLNQWVQIALTYEYFKPHTFALFSPRVLHFVFQTKLQ